MVNLRFSLNLCDVGDEVHILRLHPRLPVDKLGTDVHDGEQHQGEVICDECRLIPITLQEDGPSTKLHIKVRAVKALVQ